MSRWRAILLSFAMLLFAASGVAQAAPAPGGPPPCHEMAGMAERQAPKTKGQPHPAVMAMNCCLGCLPSTALAGGLSAPLSPPRLAAFTVRHDLLEGLTLAPDPGPPRAG